MSHLADGARVIGIGCTGHCGWTLGSASLPWRRVEDNAPYLRHDCGDTKHGRVVCPHTAVKVQAVKVIAERAKAKADD